MLELLFKNLKRFERAGCFSSLPDIDIELVISEGVYLVLSPVAVGCDTCLWFVTVECCWHRSMSGGSGVNLNIIKTPSPGRWTEVDTGHH